MSANAIVIAGSGPAAAACAIGLARLGEKVIVVGEPRRFDAVEGVTARTLAALQGLGLDQALQAFAPPSPRRARWLGVESAANQECLLDRRRFDQGLLDDLERLGIALVRGRISEVRSAPGRHQLDVDTAAGRQQVEGRFLVEARGRQAPAGGLPRVRGPETVSLLQYWQGPAQAAHSAVESLPDGWAWMAAMGDGRRYLQLTLDVATAALPAKKELAAYCRQRFAAIDSAAPFLADASAQGEPYARTSTTLLNEVLAGEDWLRIGDAAMAVDPLSGNGIFQALSSALQAPAVIATLLHDPERAALARSFHQQRIEQLFYRFARIGRDFHAQETRWAEQAFWQVRRQWPDEQALHVTVRPEDVQLGRRPVLSGGRIIEAEVVLTPDQPLGVWHVDGVAVAPLLQLARSAPSGSELASLFSARTGLSAAVAARLADWMKEQGWL